MNVSQDEYSRMYDVYLSRLEQRKIDEATEDSENVPKFYTFYQKGMFFFNRIIIKLHLVNLNFTKNVEVFLIIV